MYAFVWEKDKTMDFSETIVVYDLKLAPDDWNDKWQDMYKIMKQIVENQTSNRCLVHLSRRLIGELIV